MTYEKRPRNGFADHCWRATHSWSVAARTSVPAAWLPGGSIATPRPPTSPDAAKPTSPRYQTCTPDAGASWCTCADTPGHGAQAAGSARRRATSRPMMKRSGNSSSQPRRRSSRCGRLRRTSRRISPARPVPRPELPGRPTRPHCRVGRRGEGPRYGTLDPNDLPHRFTTGSQRALPLRVRQEVQTVLPREGRRRSHRSTGRRGGGRAGARA